MQKLLGYILKVLDNLICLHFFHLIETKFEGYNFKHFGSLLIRNAAATLSMTTFSVATQLNNQSNASQSCKIDQTGRGFVSFKLPLIKISHNPFLIL